jgi:hypothetical protein
VSDLHFAIVDYYVGVDVLVINYPNQRGGLAQQLDSGRRGEGHVIGEVPAHTLKVVPLHAPTHRSTNATASP